MKNQHVLIVGAGMGGLAAALTLQRFGFRVSVYEQARVINEIGAGVVIGPNGQRVLDFLGVGQYVRENAGSAKHTYIKHYATGETLRVLSLDDTFEKYGYANLFSYRADLHAALYQAVLANDPNCVHAGHRFADLTQDDTGVTLHFDNGAVVRGDVLIGADGNASPVRLNVFKAEDPKFTGQVAFRAVVPVERWSPEMKDLLSASYVGPKRVFLHYPMRRNTLMNVIGVGRTERWQEEGWAIPAEISEFVEHYHDYHTAVLDVIESIPPDRLFKWGLRDREPLEVWTRGRVTMLGDAAHPVLPFLGQGANIALEDGLVLGRCFEKSADFEEAFSRYEAARKERGTNIQLWSREEADAMQGNTPDGSQHRTAEDRGIFDYDPVNVVI
jgi:2-polyprenyl-6-methoxyphenol hydroxylase-like FAD-dependent oxidoreductase